MSSTFCRFQIDDQFEFGRGLHREIRRLAPLENSIGIRRRAPELIGQINSVGRETTGIRVNAVRADCRQARARDAKAYYRD